MSIKLYWGANGSFKSASACQDDIIPELKKGRTVITNLRGCTMDKVTAVYPDMPEGADIIYIDTTQPGAYDRLREWPWWAPPGALVVLDEIQLIYRKSWTARQMAEKFQKFEKEEEAEAADKPFDLLDAFTRHRHWNWDVVFTTPNIKYVRDDIRDTTEVAYRQANMGLIGVKGKFKRAMHPASDNKPGAGSLVQTLKIKNDTFKCYQSTSTGIVQDTRAGTNVFKSPRLLLALACSASGFVYAVSSGGLDYFFTDYDSQLARATEEASSVGGGSALASDPVDSASNPPEADTVSGDNVVIVETDYGNNDLGPYSDHRITINGCLVARKDGRHYEACQFTVQREGQTAYSLRSIDLQMAGYKLERINACAYRLHYEDDSRMLTCGGFQAQAPQAQIVAFQ